MERSPKLKICRPDHAVSVRDLNLSTTTIGDGAVADLSRITSLRDLNLNGTKITAEGVAKLRASLPDSRIISDHGTFEPTNPPNPIP